MSLSDLELLCILLGSGTSARPVQDLAMDILEVVAQKGTETLKVSDLTGIDGLGPAKATAICASLEIGRRLSPKRARAINDSDSAFQTIRHYGDRQQEHFLCLMLNGAHELMGVNVVSVGLVNRTIVHAREVFSDPIRERATAIILAHNHPSGNLEPSTDDLETTYRMQKDGQLLGIQVLDHLIFSMDGYHSMREYGEMMN